MPGVGPAARRALCRLLPRRLTSRGRRGLAVERVMGLRDMGDGGDLYDTEAQTLEMPLPEVWLSASPCRPCLLAFTLLRVRSFGWMYGRRPAGSSSFCGWAGSRGAASARSSKGASSPCPSPRSATRWASAG